MISFLAAMPSLFLPAPAAALNLGISNAFDYSNKDMENVRRMLMTGIPLFNFKLVAANAFDYSNKDMENVRRMLMSVARHCVLKDRNSFVQFQASTGVEVLSS
ncbi:hypothetical protein SDJN03_18563, partial [Cucurbita argyrosperma subsp. sororia]